MFSPGCDHPDPHALQDLCAAIAARAEQTATEGPWASGSFAALASHGALAGFIPADCGGTAAGEAALLELLAAVAERCLTTALALSQWAAGCRIIAGGDDSLRAARLPALARGAETTTVGISQLSTSRRHLGTTALTATPTGPTWRLDGLCPWVTGADSTDALVVGGALADGKHVFFVVPRDAPGLSIAPPLHMLALSGSRTSSVTFAGVTATDVITPREGGVRTGGLATTALALGASRAAVNLVRAEAAARPALAAAAEGLAAKAEDVWSRLLTATAAAAVDRDRLRADANSLVVRAAQAALTATKGAGFVVGHPAERLVRESLFFLVWSCPQAVSTAVLCDLAGLDRA
jgi:alkylation response protein AidB-like acyl-CoA dehydrogenase